MTHSCAAMRVKTIPNHALAAGVCVWTVQFQHLKDAQKLPRKADESVPTCSQAYSNSERQNCDKKWTVFEGKLVHNMDQQNQCELHS